MEVTSLFREIPDHIPVELLQTLVHARAVRIERIVSRGQASPEGFWYDQEWAEWVLVVSGAARLRFEGEEPAEIVAGSYVNIPAHVRHRVEWTDPDQVTVWLAVHYAP
jgi:cupin 2 domain-containing protein